MIVLSNLYPACSTTQCKQEHRSEQWLLKPSLERYSQGSKCCRLTIIRAICAAPDDNPSTTAGSTRVCCASFQLQALQLQEATVLCKVQLPQSGWWQQAGDASTVDCVVAGDTAKTHG